MRSHHSTYLHNLVLFYWQVGPKVSPNCPQEVQEFPGSLGRIPSSRFLNRQHLFLGHNITSSGQKYPKPKIPKRARAIQKKPTRLNLEDFGSICLISYTPFGSSRAMSLSITCTDTLFRFFIIHFIQFWTETNLFLLFF